MYNEKHKYSFTKSNRLLNSKQFDFVFKKAIKSSCKEFLFLLRKNENNEARLGLIVSKKTAKKAIERNKIKRVVRETFRYNKIALKGNDIIFLSRPEVKFLSKKELRQVLELQWKNLLKNLNS